MRFAADLHKPCCSACKVVLFVLQPGHLVSPLCRPLWLLRGCTGPAPAFASWLIVDLCSEGIQPDTL